MWLIVIGAGTYWPLKSTPMATTLVAINMALVPILVACAIYTWLLIKSHASHKHNTLG